MNSVHPGKVEDEFSTLPLRDQSRPSYSAGRGSEPMCRWPRVARDQLAMELAPRSGLFQLRDVGPGRRIVARTIGGDGRCGSAAF